MGVCACLGRGCWVCWAPRRRRVRGVGGRGERGNGERGQGRACVIRILFLSNLSTEPHACSFCSLLSLHLSRPTTTSTTALSSSSFFSSINKQPLHRAHEAGRVGRGRDHTRGRWPKRGRLQRVLRPLARVIGLQKVDDAEEEQDALALGVGREGGGGGEEGVRGPALSIRAHATRAGAGRGCGGCGRGRCDRGRHSVCRSRPVVPGHPVRRVGWHGGRRGGQGEGGRGNAQARLQAHGRRQPAQAAR